MKYMKETAETARLIAEHIIKGAEQIAADAEEIRNLAQTQEITYAEAEDYEPIWSGHSPE